jgi:4-amino-4-deoxy-L-arabinose transferase-like glycosyltransferase
MLGSTFLLSAEAAIAAADGVLTGAVTLAMAALARLYLAEWGGPPAGAKVRALLWAGLIASILVKGPIGPMIVVIAMVALSIWDRSGRWLKAIGWGWGLIALVAIVGPWAMAVTVASDGGFWGASLGGDLVPKLTGAAEHHGEPPGFYLLLDPLLLFPATLALPAGLLTGWRSRAQPAVRFALCWLVPAWLMFEAVPTKLIHYPLPLYGALAWLMAKALTERPDPWARRIGVALALLAALVFAALGPAALVKFGDARGSGWAFLAAALYLLAGATMAWFARSPARALMLGGAAALAAHAVLLGLVLPGLRPLWLSNRAAKALSAAGASPRQGVFSGPVTVAGYEEPSIVFLLGTDTELGDAQAAADAIADGRPAIVEARQGPAFQAALAAVGTKARRAGEGAGLDYSNGAHDVLQIFLPEHPPEAEP